MPRPVHTGNAPPAAVKQGVDMFQHGGATAKLRTLSRLSRSFSTQAWISAALFCPRGPYRGSAADKHAGRHRGFTVLTRNRIRKHVFHAFHHGGSSSWSSRRSYRDATLSITAGRCKDHNARPAAGNQDPDRPGRERPRLVQ